MKSSFNTPSKLVQNIFIEKEQHSNFDLFTHKIPSTKPTHTLFKDLTNATQQKNHKDIQTNKKISSFKNKSSNQIVQIGSSLVLQNQHNNIQKLNQKKQDLHSRQSLSEVQKRNLQNNFSNQNKNIVKNQISNHAFIETIQSINIQPKDQKQVQNTKIFYQTQNNKSKVDCHQKENQFSNLKINFPPVHKTSKICLQLDDNSSSDESEESSKQKQERLKQTQNFKQTPLKKINYNGSAIFKTLRRESQQRQKSSIKQNKQQKWLNQLEKQRDDQKIQQNCTQKHELNRKNQIKNSIISIPIKKNNIFLMNFDQDSQNQPQQQNSSENQSRQKVGLDVNSNQSVKNEQQKATQQKKNNVLLYNFGQSSQQDQKQSKQTQTQQKSKNSCGQNSQNGNCQLLRPIHILEFSRLSSQNYIYAPVPVNCVLQTLIKRYTAQNSSVVYQMLDSGTYKSILKVKKCQQGFQIFNSKETLNGSSLSSSKLTRQNQQNSCALINTNFFGTEFNCYKFNRNNQKPIINKLHRLITIKYETNFFGLKGPRKMTAYIPLSNYIIRGQKNLQEVYQRQKQNNSSSLQKVKIQKFINKTPRWNSKICGFVLNFNGRATVSSVKNFIMTKQANQEQKQSKKTNSNTHKQLQDNEQKPHEPNFILFGKIDKDIFNLDIRHPFNIIQGMVLALSSFDKKLGCQ